MSGFIPGVGNCISYLLMLKKITSKSANIDLLTQFLEVRNPEAVQWAALAPGLSQGYHQDGRLDSGHLKASVGFQGLLLRPLMWVLAGDLSSSLFMPLCRALFDMAAGLSLNKWTKTAHKIPRQKLWYFITYSPKWHTILSLGLYWSQRLTLMQRAGWLHKSLNQWEPGSHDRINTNEPYQN